MEVSFQIPGAPDTSDDPNSTPASVQSDTLRPEKCRTPVTTKSWLGVKEYPTLARSKAANDDGAGESRRVPLTDALTEEADRFTVPLKLLITLSAASTALILTLTGVLTG